MQKISCYVDESGQDTRGTYFIVVVVLVEKHFQGELEKTVEKIEKESGKTKKNRPRKWTDTRLKEKTAYLSRILQIPQLEQSIFYISFRDTTDYTELTTYTIAQAIKEKTTSDSRVDICIDGLNDKERSRVAKGLHQYGILKRKLKGGRDESNAFLRLADAMAGFIRDYEEGEPYAQEFYSNFTQKKILVKLKA